MATRGTVSMLLKLQLTRKNTTRDQGVNLLLSSDKWGVAPPTFNRTLHTEKHPHSCQDSSHGWRSAMCFALGQMSISHLCAWFSGGTFTPADTISLCMFFFFLITEKDKREKRIRQKWSSSSSFIKFIYLFVALDNSNNRDETKT